ncbi:MAG: ATP-grasp domain-containing protein [Methylococcales bacterium]|nr:ATP-grasp domain-containing protein [Methylococcales bacterium]
MRQRNVLIFPAGTEIGLEIFHALKYCKEVRLFGAGQDISNHAKFVFQEYHIIPSIIEPDWLDQLIYLCQSLSIDYIFPAYDDIIVALSQRAEQLLPAKVISSPLYACETTRSKLATYQALQGSIRVPKIYGSTDEIDDFPVLIKPDCGQGSFGIVRVDEPSHLLAALNSIPKPIICEYLPGEEYTVDCFSDRDKGVLFASARTRRRMRNGIAVNTIMVDLPEAWKIASTINHILALHGAWFFQLKRAVDGELTLLEVAPRIAGSMATHRVSGVNFPLLSIFEEERLEIHIKQNAGVVELDRALGNRYHHSVKFSTLYIDLDDTLIVNDKVNPLAIKLVFQCINDGKQIILLTRHGGDLHQTLSKFRLTNLFDNLIHLSAAEKKSAYIGCKDAIFVDDSFAERMDVSINCNIPTFDCSMIEMLTEQSEIF